MYYIKTNKNIEYAYKYYRKAKKKWRFYGTM